MGSLWGFIQARPELHEQTLKILPSSPANATAIRLANLEKRNQKLRDTFDKRYTNKPRLQKLGREVVVQQLADEYFLSLATVERIILPRG